uniref:Uncharacterized protein n=1 Tax=viral metagenome TaxID=1070528 RepID=A0A6C0EQ46_9ZZZZ
MEKLPFDIIINHIIPYTYNIQAKLLLEDIKNYYEIKKILMDDKYNTNIIKRELLSVLYSKTKATRIWSRRFQVNSKEYNYKILYKYSQNTRFNILFGLFSKQERIFFSEYIKQIQQSILK